MLVVTVVTMVTVMHTHRPSTRHKRMRSIVRNDVRRPILPLFINPIHPIILPCIRGQRPREIPRPVHARAGIRTRGMRGEVPCKIAPRSAVELRDRRETLPVGVAREVWVGGVDVVLWVAGGAVDGGPACGGGVFDLRRREGWHC